jgi:hypothetical protein
MVFRFLLAFLLAQEFVAAQSPNHIDSLTTAGQVLSFVQGLDTQYHSFIGAAFHPPVLKDCFGKKIWREYQQRVDSFGTTPYEKIDIDGNGETDLLFNGYDTVHNRGLTLVILSFGKDSFVVDKLPKEHRNLFIAARTVHIGNELFLAILTLAEFHKEISLRKRPIKIIDGFQWQRDTLRCLSAGLVEAMRPAEHKVKRLKYQLLLGFSMDGGYELTILQDSLRLEKGCDFSPNTPIDSGGIFIAKMDTATAHQLRMLFNYINFDQLKTNYSVGYSDGATGDFEILYDHHKRKTISDYGLIGTYALTTLQELLINLLKTQAWTRTKPGGRDFFYLPTGFWP